MLVVDGEGDACVFFISEAGCCQEVDPVIDLFEFEASLVVGDGAFDLGGVGGTQQLDGDGGDGGAAGVVDGAGYLFAGGLGEGGEADGEGQEEDGETWQGLSKVCQGAS